MFETRELCFPAMENGRKHFFKSFEEMELVGINPEKVGLRMACLKDRKTKR
jgi:hypothetical protein